VAILTNLNEERLDSFLKLFTSSRKSTRDERIQRFITTTLLDILNLNPQTYRRNLLEILTALNNGTPEQINHYKQPRLPLVFQRASGSQPIFSLLLSSPVQICLHPFSQKISDRLPGLIGRFLTVTSQPLPRATITIDGAELSPVNFGEMDSWYLLNDGNRHFKSILTIDSPPPETLTWFVIQIGVISTKFIPDFAGKRGLVFVPDAPLPSRNSRCSCEGFELRDFLARIRQQEWHCVRAVTCECFCPMLSRLVAPHGQTRLPEGDLRRCRRPKGNRRIRRRLSGSQLRWSRRRLRKAL
jgi:hypothetical protein